MPPSFQRKGARASVAIRAGDALPLHQRRPSQTTNNPILQILLNPANPSSQLRPSRWAFRPLKRRLPPE